MRRISVDIYYKDNLVHSIDYDTDKSPESVTDELVHNASGAVYEGRSVRSWTMNKDFQLIEVELLSHNDADMLPLLFPDHRHQQIREDIDFSITGEITCIRLPDDLSVNEKQEIFEIIQSEAKGTCLVVDSTSQYEYGGSGFWENFLASVSSTYAARVIDKLYVFFKGDNARKKQIKSYNIPEGVRQFIADNCDIKKTNLILIDLVEENGEYILTFKSNRKEIMVHVDDKMNIKSLTIEKKAKS